VTGNERYLHRFTPQMKQVDIHRKYVTSPKTKVSGILPQMAGRLCRRRLPRWV